MWMKQWKKLLHWKVLWSTKYKLEARKAVFLSRETVFLAFIYTQAQGEKMTSLEQVYQAMKNSNPPGYTQDIVDIKQDVVEYWEERTESFAQLREAELQSNKFARWEQELLRHLPTGRSLRILDVGCGCGFFDVMLARHGHQVTGIDLTPTMVEQSRIIAAKYGCQVEFQIMDAEQLSFADATFDVVLSRNLTWTLPHPRAAYQEWCRVLVKGGILLNYDAEYAKYYALRPSVEDKAHQDLPTALTAKCRTIYDSLKISSCSRPQWDLAVLAALGMHNTAPDLSIRDAIYQEQDQFYIAAPIFRIKAIK